MFYCFQIAQWGDGSDVVSATHPNQNQFKSDSPAPHPHWLPSNTLSTVSPAVQPLQLGHRHHVLREPAVLPIISPTPSSPSYLHLYSGVHSAPGPAIPHFFPSAFLVNESLTCLEGKSMLYNIALCSLQQLPSLSLGPLREFLG